MSDKIFEHCLLTLMPIVCSYMFIWLPVVAIHGLQWNLRLFPVTINFSFGDGMSWATWQIRKIVGCACAWNSGNVFFPPPTSMQTANKRSRHIGNNPGIPGAYATRNFAYLVRGPLESRTASNSHNTIADFGNVFIWLVVTYKCMI